MKSIWTILLVAITFLYWQTINAQVQDSLKMPAVKDTSATIKNSIQPWFTQHTSPAKTDVWVITTLAKPITADRIFYLLCGLLLFLGTIRLLFPKYFADLFALFFNITFKQKAVKERLVQSTLPSVLLNVFFFCSAGIFLFFLSQYFQWNLKNSFWYGVVFWCVLLSLIYAFKYILLTALGWLLQLRETGKVYGFIVFIVNKVAGVLIIPFLVLLSLGPVAWRPVLVTLSLIIIGGLYVYRFAISYQAVRATMSLNRFHFFIYLCAFEIVPFLILYKVLSVHLSTTY